MIYAVSIPFCITVLLRIINGFVAPVNTKCSSHELDTSLVPYFILLQYAPFCLIPFCGWLSDTKIGRGNAIYLSL